MDYCPKCGKRMIHMKKKNNQLVTLILSCKKCGYEKKANRPNFNNTLNKNYRVEKLIILGQKEQKLKTTPTIKRNCPKCNNDQVYAWLVDLGSLEQSSTQFYRCTRCNYTIREVN
jgi:DNA-directed RNA polymerase subunit M